MADAARILQRIRKLGANVVVEDGNLVVINKAKLPDDAMRFIQSHAQAIAVFLEGETEAVDERAAIIEFDGKTPRQWAEQFADIIIRQRPAGVSDLDWSWFIARCGQILEEAPTPEAA